MTPPDTPIDRQGAGIEPSPNSGDLKSRIFSALLRVGPVKPSKPSYMWNKLQEYAEAAADASIEHLEHENTELRRQVELARENFSPLVEAAEGLSAGNDWNKGAQALQHGYRKKLVEAIPGARKALSELGSCNRDAGRP